MSYTGYLIQKVTHFTITCNSWYSKRFWTHYVRMKNQQKQNY